ncbi:MAG: hypothetical protein JW810_13385 [Sedimentisphaerales bacterium]|nr:hypothetical protein [Sedimentisphaerales bacterium]
MRHVKRAILIVVVALCGTTYGFSGGDGSPGDPYQIATAAELLSIGSDAELLGKCYLLTADIDLDPLVRGVPPFVTAVIAPDADNTNSDFEGHPFTGVFDGGGHTIRHLTIDTLADDDPNNNGNDYLGLFGSVQNGRVLNLHLEDVAITGGHGSRYLGGLAGRNYRGEADHCSAAGWVAAGENVYYLGGLVGANYSGAITNSYAAADVRGGSGSWYLGGLAGYNSGAIGDCYATGSVTGQDDYLGGLVGANSGAISNGYAEGDVAGEDYLGGLVGRNWYGAISCCYATGSVTGVSSLGGLLGSNASTVAYGYFLHPTDGGGPINGIGTALTDAQMRRQASFVGWDFVGDDHGTKDHWQMCIDRFDHPRLAWQFSVTGDFIDPGRVDIYDSYVLVGDWLSESSRCCDIAPPGSPDGIVNLLDYAEFARHWLAGVDQDAETPSGWLPPQLVLAWNANPRILVPYVTADKLTMYYSRNNQGHWEVLQTHRDDPADPFPVGQVIPELAGGFCPWLSTDGLRMYYTMDNTGDQIIHLAERADTDSPWQHVRALTEIHAAGNDDNSPCVTADELILTWTSYRYVGYGIAASLWTATRNSINEPFSGAVNLGELNLHGWNSMPCIMPDGLTIYFYSGHPHPWQFFKATRNSLQEPFSNIQALQLTDGSPFDGHAPFVTPDEQDIYFYSEWMGVGEGICVSHYQP